MEAAPRHQDIKIGVKRQSKGGKASLTFELESNLSLLVALFTAILAASLAAGLTGSIYPLLVRHALARPNARSSHTTPTPQGAGLAVVAATLVISGIAIALLGVTGMQFPIVVFVTTIFITFIGAIDDIRPIPALPRLLAHTVVVGAILTALPSSAQIFPTIPMWLERGLLLIAGVWFVNVVNFMDGLDWMTVAEVIPVASTLTAIGISGCLPPATALTMAALGGAMVGFAPFNRPVAKVFLGDVGSLPIGLLLGWALLELAAQGHMAAALLLPLYYLSDATVTIFRRGLNRERIWVAHRTHFYQQATDNGFAVMQVVGTVFWLNVLLAALAAVSIVWSGPLVQLTMLALGSVAVTAVLLRFSHSQKSGAL